MSGPRVGIFGGSFNPIHLAHLVAADDARATLGLDRVLFVPARVPPHKSPGALLDGDERAAMIEIALRGAPGLELSRVDLDRDGPSYTVETIRIIRASLPESAEVFFLMGADSLADLASWRAPDEILRLANVVVFPRAGHDPTEAPAEIRARVRVLETPLLAISSDEIRQRIRDGRPTRFLLPDGVWSRIAERGHYRAGG